MALPTPVGKQKEVVTLMPEGHVVVLGTAGSGKTTMAIHRAVFVADERADHGGRTLLVTFNRALVTYLEHLRPPELLNVDVRTFHRFARGYLASRDLMSYDAICDDGPRLRIIAQALEVARERNPRESLYKREVDFFSEEIRWINHHGIQSQRAYVEVDRVGRATARLRKADRPYMFELYESYRRLRKEELDHDYDWDDLASAVRRELESDQDGRMYSHVVVDEGQDFSPEMVRSLALAIPETGSLTMFADVAQQIYGRRISWADAGLEISEPWKFEKNYRNSPQIAELGLAIASMPYYAGEPDMVAPTEFAADGPRPILVRFGSSNEEKAFVIDQARRAAESGSVAVLVRRHADEAMVASSFPNAQRLHSDMDAWIAGPGVSYGTYHAAKGLEFDTVILPRLTQSRMPDPKAVEAIGLEEATAGDGRLLYVGVTRARQNLIMTCADELTQLMPANVGLWLESVR
jgi:superfamily I DNA/RNA helicase